MKLAADLHIHSCLSPCAEAEMTPNNIVNMALLKGLDVIALTDHNSGKNLPAAYHVAKEAGMTFLPGIEVESREEVHLLCYFDELQPALDFSEQLHGYLADVQNVPEIFGEQIICDATDEPVGKEEILLLQSVDRSMNQIYEMVGEFGGVMVPAHINRSSNSLLSVLGFVPKDIPLRTLEISNRFPMPDIEGYRKIVSSDAHRLGDILERESFITVAENSAQAVLAYLRGELCRP
jgi:hypothetical protein